MSNNKGQPQYPRPAKSKGTPFRLLKDGWGFLVHLADKNAPHFTVISILLAIISIVLGYVFYKLSTDNTDLFAEINKVPVKVVEAIRDQSHPAPVPSAPVPPVSIPPKPDTAPVPVWQTLASAVDYAKRVQSVAADKSVRAAYVDAKSDTSGITSDERRRLVEKAEAITRRLDESDARLRRLREAADRWRRRKGSEAPDFRSEKKDIRPYDTVRLEEEGYRADWEVLAEAEELMGWSSRGFTDQTRSAVPVYIGTGNTHDIEGKIASNLKKVLKNHLNITDEKHAALFINIENARSYSEMPRRAWLKIKGRTAFDVAMRWIDGSALPIIHEDKETDNSSGIDIDREEAVRVNSLNYAVEQACRDIALIGKCDMNINIQQE